MHARKNNCTQFIHQTKYSHKVYIKHKLQPKNSKEKRKVVKLLMLQQLKSFPPNKKKEKEKLFNLILAIPFQVLITFDSVFHEESKLIICWYDQNPLLEAIN
jgi:hypothetical protein